MVLLNLESKTPSTYHNAIQDIIAQAKNFKSVTIIITLHNITSIATI